MSALVIYDSLYGNTERIAQAIATAIQCEAKRFSDIRPDELRSVDLVVVGSPTQGGRATKELDEWLRALPADALAGVRSAAFDTRIDKQARGLPLRLLMNVIGYAAPKIAKTLTAKGAAVLGVEGFIVSGKEGPLAAGEAERAERWAKQISGDGAGVRGH